MLENKDTLIALTKSLDSVAYALHNFCIKTLEALGAPPAQAATATPPSAEAQPKAEAQTQPEEKPLKLEDVRAVMAEKSRQGKTEAIRAILESHGANKLSDIDPSKYASLLAQVEAIGNE